jgi:DNA primase
MNAQDIKRHIYENQLVETVLERIGCHSIRYHDTYWTCGNKGGDNKTAITIYNDEYLRTLNYTRQISSNPSLPTDIINLVEYNEGLSFFQAIKYLCELVGLDLYQNLEETIPESIRITRMLLAMNGGINNEEDDTPIKPIPEIVLSYYQTPCVNDMFLRDGISYQTQVLFEYGYDPLTNRVTIPIRSEFGDLVGVKGRLFKEKLDDNDLKYIYIEPCNKSKILYNLHRSYDYIKEEGFVYVGESEKMCAQLWSAGIKNSVSIGGHKFSKTQLEFLSRLCVKIVVCFDKDINQKEIEQECSKFDKRIPIEYLLDTNNILTEKQSPSDNIEKFNYLVNNCKFVYIKE